MHRIRRGLWTAAPLIAIAMGAGAGSAAPPATCNGEPVTLAGTDGPDRLTGTAARDVIHAGAGDDFVDAGGGGDLVCGGDGDDVLLGGDSFDALFGEAGDDSLAGGPDDDVLFVGPGLDAQTATGGPGYDVAYGDEGSETCAAEAMYVCAVTNAEDDTALPFALPEAVPCDLLAAPAGDDANPGSPAQPFRTAERMINTLQPGETGCLAPGEVFTEPDHEILVRSHGEPGRPITVRTLPGAARATIRGRVWVADEAHDVHFRDLILDGRNPLASLQGNADPEAAPGLPSPAVDGDRVEFADVSASSSGAGTCFLLGSEAQSPVIRRTRVSLCGRVGDQIETQLEHGIVVRSARRALIADSVIDLNADAGIVIGEDARDTVVRSSLVSRNARAVLFEGVQDADGNYLRPGGSLVTLNVLADSRLGDFASPGHWQVEGTFDPAEDWADNVVELNCLAHADEPPRHIQEPRSAFTARDNVGVASGRCDSAAYGPADTAPAYPPPPVAKLAVNVEPVRDGVEVKRPRAETRRSAYLPLVAAAGVGLGTAVDTTGRGRAALTVATGPRSRARLTIWGGSVTVHQSGGRRPYTELRLRGAYVGDARTAARKRRLRRQWGRGKCRRCRIRGRYGRASHPRSQFLVEDRCAGTRVYVKRGSVRFEDFVTGRSRRVRAGRSYTARPKRRPC